MEEKREAKKLRKIMLSDVVKIYLDPETETKVEGHGFVWEILSQDENFYTLVVSFLEDPTGRTGRKFTRKYRKYDL